MVGCSFCFLRWEIRGGVGFYLSVLMLVEGGFSYYGGVGGVF